MAEDPTGLPGSLRAGCVPLLMPLADAGVKAGSPCRRGAGGCFPGPAGGMGLNKNVCDQSSWEMSELSEFLTFSIGGVGIIYRINF
jgi:hypothetical protein